MITSEEAFLGRKLDVSHFRIFGASIYFHVSKESRKKLELTTKLRVIVGYTKCPHNYHFCFLSLRIRVAQRNVKFDEEIHLELS